MARSIIINQIPVIQTNQTVITPTRQTARALNAPHRDLDSLALGIIRRNGWSIASPLTQKRLLSQAIQDTYPTADILGTARVLASSVNILLRANVDLTALQNHDLDSIRQLATLTHTYQNQLHNQQKIDPSELFWVATQQNPKKRSLLIYGYFNPRRDQLHFIDAIAGENSLFAFPCNDENIFNQNLESLTFLRRRKWHFPQNPPFTETPLQTAFLTSDPLNYLPTHCHSYPSLEAEIRGTLAQVKSLLHQGIPPTEIVIVARDEQRYGPTLLDIAWEYDLPLRALYPIPLQQTRLGAWLNLLLQVINTHCPFETTAQLLAHPLSEYLPPPFWEKARQQHPNGLDAWEKLGIDLSCLHLPSQSSRKQWKETLQRILDTFGLAQRGKQNARDMIAYHRVKQALEELAQPDNEEISQNQFFSEVEEMLGLLSVPVQPGRGGVEFHTPLSLFGAKYQHVFVLGMAEGVFPAPLDQDIVLNFYTRKQLVQQGFPFATAVEMVHQEALSFYSLLAVPTMNLTLSYSRLLENQPTLPSPYLDRLGVTVTSPPVVPPASLEEMRMHNISSLDPDPVLAQIRHAVTVEQQRDSEAAPQEYEGATGVAFDTENWVFSVSQLTKFGQCSFKWFAEYGLGLQELKEAQDEVNPSLKGQFYHRCLELAFQDIKTPQDLLTLGLDRVTEAFSQVEEEFDLTRVLGWNRSREEHLKTLGENFKSEAFLPVEGEILALETDFQGDWYGLKITGKVDRIDRTPSGLRILDYKTRSSAPKGIKDEEGKAKIDIQLPLYAEAIAKQYPEENITETIYYSVTKQRILKQNKSDRQCLEDFSQKVKDQFKDGYFPVDPDVKQEACKYCPFNLVCRV